LEGTYAVLGDFFDGDATIMEDGVSVAAAGATKSDQASRTLSTLPIEISLDRQARYLLIVRLQFAVEIYGFMGFRIVLRCAVLC